MTFLPVVSLTSFSFFGRLAAPMAITHQRLSAPKERICQKKENWSGLGP
jgi:hypothetical protein